MTGLGPGVYDIPADVYHADPVEGGSLSSTGARYLLDNCPAKFAHWRTTEAATKVAWDEGSAAHKLVLGAGPELVKIEGNGADVNAWRTTSGPDSDQARVAAARAAGKTPLKPKQWTMVHDMAAALRRHKLAASLLEPSAGKAEQTIVWRDPASGVMLRSLVDFLRHPNPAGTFVVVDYKTCVSAHPDAVERSAAEWGYHIQGWWYRQAVKAAGYGGADVRFVLVAQEKTPPYLVSVTFPDEPALLAGGLRARDAINVYAECVESGVWPGYPEQGVPISLPPWELQKAGVGEW